RRTRSVPMVSPRSTFNARSLVLVALGVALIIGGGGAAKSFLSAAGIEEIPSVGYAGDAASTRFFPSKQIDKSNVAKLEVAWIYPHAEATFHPMMVHGVFYGRVGGDAIVALDAKTGKLLWVHDGLNGMTARGMNYWESKDGKDRRLIFAV